MTDPGESLIWILYSSPLFSRGLKEQKYLKTILANAQGGCLVFLESSPKFQYSTTILSFLRVSIFKVFLPDLIVGAKAFLFKVYLGYT